MMQNVVEGKECIRASAVDGKNAVAGLQARLRGRAFRLDTSNHQHARLRESAGVDAEVNARLPADVVHPDRAVEEDGGGKQRRERQKNWTRQRGEAGHGDLLRELYVNLRGGRGPEE